MLTLAVAIRYPRPSPRLSSTVFRLSSFVSRPSSLVPRKLRGISRGPQPPGRWGRIPKGTAFGIGSLWRFLSPISFTPKEMGSRRSAKTLVLFPSFVPAAAGGGLPLGGAGAKRLMRESPPQRAILHVSADSPFAFASLLPCPVASGGPLSLPPKKEAKETARGDLFRGGPL